MEFRKLLDDRNACAAHLLKDLPGAFDIVYGYGGTDVRIQYIRQVVLGGTVPNAWRNVDRHDKDLFERIIECLKADCADDPIRVQLVHEAARRAHQLPEHIREIVRDANARLLDKLLVRAYCMGDEKSAALLGVTPRTMTVYTRDEFVARVGDEARLAIENWIV